MNVQPIPEGLHTVTPFLMIQGAAKLIEFLRKSFDAQEKECIVCPDGSVAHAQVIIGDSVVMISDLRGHGFPRSATLYLYLADADAAYASALVAGATSLMEPQNMFWGDRLAIVQDPFGNNWQIATHVEDVSPEESQRRLANPRK